tara:strand:- start:98166 stop:98885 length:720 start_codon:yes stop_codon:yes gene_type:complete
VIGDIHGEFSKLKKLISLINKIDKNPKLIFLGDYIDKGENSKITLDYLVELKLKFETIFLMGNHEYQWLNYNFYTNQILEYGGLRTINDFNSSDIADCQNILINKYKKIFDRLKRYVIIENFFICHSGILNETESFKSLNEIKIESLLFNRYEFLNQKNLFKSKYKIIFGHTAFYNPYVDDFKIGIDTGACYLADQPLTSFCIDNYDFINSNGESYNIEHINKDYCPLIIRNKKLNKNV